MRDERLRALLDPGAPVTDAARARAWTVVRHAYAGQIVVDARERVAGAKLDE